jgi:histone-lysine N-methyltransferase SETD2
MPPPIVIHPLPYQHELPPEFHPYLYNVANVDSDGHCGFRAVAGLMGLRQENWLRVQVALLFELNQHVDNYTDMFGLARFNEISDSLTVTSNEPVGLSKWMTAHDMGHLIASAYRVVCLVLDLSGSTTFFPLWEPVDHPIKHRIITLGYVNRSHFVQVFLKDGHPMPRTAPQWIWHCDLGAKAWETPYKERQEKYVAFLKQKHGSNTEDCINISAN